MSRKTPQPRWELLNPDDIHKPGDEVWIGLKSGWQPLPAIHMGDAVGNDSAPCRRRGTPDFHPIKPPKP